MGIIQKIWGKTIFGPKWTIPERAVLLVIMCVYEQKKHTFIKLLDINKTLPTLIRTYVATPPRHPCSATCNSLREIEICLFSRYPILVLVGYLTSWGQVACTEKLLRDVSKSHFNGLKSEFIYFAIVSSQYRNNKGKKSVGMVSTLKYAEVYAQDLLLGEATPCFSVSLSIMRIHCCI